MSDDDDKPRIDPGYPLGQLLKALSSAGERAAERANQWQQMLAQLFDGRLRVGSRTPLVDTPAWVTLDVVHGGFATGNLAAGGPLQPHEVEWLVGLVRPPGATKRTALNLHFLGDAGLTQLEAMLAGGRYRIRVPEEGALLVVAWLLRRGEAKRAAELIETITPFSDRLRFYPAPHAHPVRSGECVFVQTAGDAVRSLRAKRPQTSVERMNESIRVWAPLYDRAVALFLQTVTGDTPALRRTGSGELARGQDSQPIVEGGWPCRRYPDDWNVRARELLDEYRTARARHRLCGKPDKSNENFARLRGYLETCVEDPGSLTGRDVGMIRKILASFIARHGAPGSSRLQGTRAAQARMAARPAYTAFARVLAERLEQHPQDEGVPDLEDALRPLSTDDASRIGAAPGEPMPGPLLAKAVRCLEAPIGVLIEKGLVPSSEAMAKVLPSLTAQVRAAAISDPELRRVYAGVYVAFRRRRSLLLLDLASQVKLGELPWISAVEPWVGGDRAARDAARGSLAQAVTLALSAFPQTILPNKLMKELRTLASGAGLSLPLVDELAADIFMGAFSQSFLRAGKVAARLLGGTLYEHYYGLPYERLARLDDVEEQRFETPSSPGFAALCEKLAAAPARGSRSVARNGAIIEQAQILTTHNLAVLFDALDLAGTLPLGQMARRTFEWICRRQQMKIKDWRAQLQMVKNTAYAWRQMVFYLALLETAELSAFLEWSAAHMQTQSGELRQRFEPVVAGLRAVLAGERFGADGIHAASGGRRFLGWSVGRHWLLPQGAGRPV
jgi:hypothetical protein